MSVQPGPCCYLSCCLWRCVEQYEVVCFTMQIWRYAQKSGEWQQDGATLVGHTDWVRDVAWAPNLGLPKSVIASAGQDGKVLIWTESRDVPGQWTPTLHHDFKVQHTASRIMYTASLWAVCTKASFCAALHFFLAQCMRVPSVGE